MTRLRWPPFGYPSEVQVRSSWACHAEVQSFVPDPLSRLGVAQRRADVAGAVPPDDKGPAEGVGNREGREDSSCSEDARRVRAEEGGAGEQVVKGSWDGAVGAGNGGWEDAEVTRSLADAVLDPGEERRRSRGATLISWRVGEGRREPSPAEGDVPLAQGGLAGGEIWSGGQRRGGEEGRKFKEDLHLQRTMPPPRRKCPGRRGSRKSRRRRTGTCRYSRGRTTCRCIRRWWKSSSRC